MQTPLIIGHRGACGYLPEHSSEAYLRASEMGADWVETDVVLTRDGHLVCSHDCELSATTDITLHSEFSGRKRTQTIDGEVLTGWFIEDFTLVELSYLRLRQRFPFRDHSYDDRFGLLTLAQLLDLAAGRITRKNNALGVVIEIKHANHHRSIGLPIEAPVAEILRSRNLDRSDSHVWVECFEVDILKRLAQQVKTPIVQLLDAPHRQPPDVTAMGGSLTYARMIAPPGLAEIASYASAIGAWKRLIVPRLDTSPGVPGPLGAPTTLIPDAHAAGLKVHAWTFRSEPPFLAPEYQSDPAREYLQFHDLGVDGLITDFPDLAAAALP